MLGARHGMTGHKMDARRNMRAEVADYRFLDRADIGQNGALLQRRTDPAPDFRIGRNRGRYHHQIGVRHRFHRVVRRFVREFEALDRCQGFGAAGAGDNGRAGVVAAQDPGQRRTDQPNPNQRHPIEQFLAHRVPMNSPSAAATFSISSPVPMVILRY